VGVKLRRSPSVGGADKRTLQLEAEAAGVAFSPLQ